MQGWTRRFLYAGKRALLIHGRTHPSYARPRLCFTSLTLASLALAELIRNDDVAGVYRALTNVKVEEKVLQRAKIKAATYGKEPLVEVDDIVSFLTSKSTTPISTVVAAAAAAAAVNAVEMANLATGEMGDVKIPPAAIEAIYRDLIIPLTKEVEVEYLFRRCGKEPPANWKERCESTAAELKQ